MQVWFKLKMAFEDKDYSIIISAAP